MRRSTLLALLLATGLPGCGDTTSDHGILIREVDARPSGQQLEVHLVQDLNLSRDAHQALRHGVPLTLRARWELRSSRSGRPIAQAQQQWEIRYLPLSEHYQLAGPDETRTYPRLRHVLAALRQIDTELPTSALDAGEYTLRARLWLDRASLPAPMQLPAVLSSSWRHDSDWSSWPLTIDA